MPESRIDGERLRIAFAGTPPFAATSLLSLIDSHHEVVVVLTQPDRRAGRGRRMTPSAVKTVALDHDIPVQQPVSLRDPEAQAALRAYHPDVLVVVAYGLILPDAVLSLPRLACINVHASLLPRWRGAAPVQRAILAGDEETGICWMMMDAGLDTGDVLARASFPLDGSETAPELTERLARLGAEGLPAVLDAVSQGNSAPESQAAEGVTYAEKLDKREARFDFDRTAIELYRCIRAFAGWPVAESLLDGERIRIHAARLPGQQLDVAPEQEALPGTILGVTADALQVMTGQGVIELTTLQRPGSRAVSADVFSHDRVLTGKRFVE